MKSFGDERIAGGESLLVVDLAACTGMDSTFMGTLAGMAARLSAMGGGVLHIAEPGERNRRSLEDLGLDFLMEIDPPGTLWRDKISAIRSDLNPPRSKGALDQIERAHHVLDAHQTLSEVNDKNARTFEGVVEMLKEQVPGKEQPKDETDGD